MPLKGRRACGQGRASASQLNNLKAGPPCSSLRVEYAVIKVIKLDCRVCEGKLIKSLSSRAGICWARTYVICEMVRSDNAPFYFLPSKSESALAVQLAMEDIPMRVLTGSSFWWCRTERHIQTENTTCEEAWHVVFELKKYCDELGSKGDGLAAFLPLRLIINE